MFTSRTLRWFCWPSETNRRGPKNSLDPSKQAKLGNKNPNITDKPFTFLGETLVCEFSVYLKAGLKEEKIAEDITSVKLENGVLILRDVLGATKNVANAIISELNVDKEVMHLRQLPVLSQLMNFIRIYEKCLTEERYVEELETAWDEVKAEGDSVLRGLWVKYVKR
jgi:predicted RNA-binding protein